MRLVQLLAHSPLVLLEHLISPWRVSVPLPLPLSEPIVTFAY
jgi:hypothetical protein